MDRFEVMKIFVATIEAGSLAAAARRLGRSPAAVTRALSLLEERIGARLLLRTTRTLRLTEAGERYLSSCRRILAEVEDAERLAAGEREAPRGTLNVTAPVSFGRLHARPLIDDFLDLHPSVRVRLLLIDRVVNLAEEGMDVALRIGPLPDSGLIATQVGSVRRILCASPAYLAGVAPPTGPADLARLRCIGFSHVAGARGWRFPPGPGGGTAQTIALAPPLEVNDAMAAVASAVEGRGVTCVLSYQADADLRAGRLIRLLPDFEPPPLPVHLVYPESRLVAAKLRAFVDFAAPRLRARLASLQEPDARGGG